MVSSKAVKTFDGEFVLGQYESSISGSFPVYLHLGICDSGPSFLCNS